MNRPGTMRVPTLRPVRGRRPTLFVVSRDRPERYESLALAFRGDRDVRVIFDRRRGERRQHADTPLIDRRRRERRSGMNDWVLRTVGWIRIPATDELARSSR